MYIFFFSDFVCLSALFSDIKFYSFSDIKQPLKYKFMDFKGCDTSGINRNKKMLTK